MWKCIGGKNRDSSPNNISTHYEGLFNCSKTTTHGFPHRPSALAWDPKLHLLAIGTKNGWIRIYGAPGVEFEGKHKKEVCVTELFFLPGQGRVISRCDDSSLHLFELKEEDGGCKWNLEEVKSCCSLQGKRKNITTCCRHSRCEQLLIGTDGGNIYFLDVKKFTLTSDVIYRDLVLQNVPDSESKQSPGPVKAIAEHPLHSDKVLIGYKGGLIVFWNNKTQAVEHTYTCHQPLESLSWHKSGTKFVSSHNDGSYVVWSTKDSSKPRELPATPYGPFPCKAIPKFIWRTVKGRSDFKIFAGGMPRASYGDKHTLSLMCGKKQQVLEFSSRIVDFFSICDGEEKLVQNKPESKGRLPRFFMFHKMYDNPHTLVVLTEEELVLIDIESEEWLPYRLPYLCSLHVSPVTCIHHCSNVPQKLWNEIIAAGNKSASEKYTYREWPIKGGENLNEDQSTRELLLTGHEDGCVRFWNASGVSLNHIYTIRTSNLFVNEEGEPREEEVEKWPPFRKVGNFDPYSDDPRLAVKKILLCVHGKTLVVAGIAGQIVYFELKEDSSERKVEVVTVNSVSDSFSWKGHCQLFPKIGSLKHEAGFVPFCIEQMVPPAQVTVLSVHTKWGLACAGTAYGFVLFDYIQKKPVMSQSTVNQNYFADAIPKNRSFKRGSLRQSLQKLRKSRSHKWMEEKTPNTPGDTLVFDSMVQCLYMAEDLTVQNTFQYRKLWAGTSNGDIHIFNIDVDVVNRKSKPVTCQLYKTLQMKLRSPVIAIQILDWKGHPLPDPNEMTRSPPPVPSSDQPQRVIVFSTDQLAVFSLPSLKPYKKLKLHEELRKVTTIEFVSKSDGDYSEYCATCLSSEGEISIITLSDLKIIQKYFLKNVKKDLSSVVFTNTGQGFYLHFPSELQRFTLSANDIVEVRCRLHLHDVLSYDEEEDDSDFPFFTLPSQFFSAIGNLSEKEVELASLIFENAQEAVADALDGRVNDDDDDIDFTDEFEKAEKGFSRIIEAFKGMEGARKNFQNLFPKWSSSRRNTISKMREIAESINKDRKNCNIAKLTGSSVGVVGGVGLIAGIVFPPAAIVGIAATAASTATVLGTSLTEVGLMDTKMKEAKDLLKKDEEQFRPMTKFFKQSQEVIDIMDEIVGFDLVQKIWKGLENFKNEFSSPSTAEEEGFSLKLQQFFLHCVEGAFVADLAVKIAFKIPLVLTYLSAIVLFRKQNAFLFNWVVATYRIVMTMVKVLQLETSLGMLVCKSALKTTGHHGARAVVTNATAAVVGKSVLAGIGIALDITNIVFDSIDVHKGSVSENAVQLKNASDKLENELKVLEAVYKALV